MRTIKIILTALIICGTTTLGTSQLALNATGSIHSIGDFEFTYEAYGLDLNGELGKNWSIGMQADYGKYEGNRFLSFNPNFKVYSKSFFEGLYLGMGLRYFKVKKLGELSLPYPLPESASNTTFFGPELKLGITTIIDYSFTMGFELHAGKAFDLDEPFYGASFTFGVYLY